MLKLVCTPVIKAQHLHIPFLIILSQGWRCLNLLTNLGGKTNALLVNLRGAYSRHESVEGLRKLGAYFTKAFGFENFKPGGLFDFFSQELRQIGRPTKMDAVG